VDAPLFYPKVASLWWIINRRQGGIDAPMFQGREATTPELLDQVHRIRYQVYCVENRFEDPARNQNGLERDEYDAHSVHGLLVHTSSKAPVGTVRLVKHRPGTRRGSLPIHRVCRHPDLLDPDFLPLETTAEFSRFAISKAFRRRAEGQTCAGNAEAERRETERLIPHITVGLITTALRLAFAHGITHVCAVMDPALLRLLSRFAIRFKPLGAQVEYHGWRQPCYTTIAAMLSEIEVERRHMWETITDNGRLWPSSLAEPQVPNHQFAEFA
jgi:N-acyl amino acid synthase of PEP-CTERM/exosortase system